MEIRTYKVYKFEELSDESKEKAVELNADICVGYSWGENTIDDAENVGLKIKGFGLDRYQHCDGLFIDSADDTANRIIREHGEKCETVATARDYLSSRCELVKKYSDGVTTDTVTEDNEYEFDIDCDGLDADFLRSILGDYAIIFQKEYDYLISEEAIIDFLNANDYDFTVDGVID